MDASLGGPSLEAVRQDQIATPVVQYVGARSVFVLLSGCEYADALVTVPARCANEIAFSRSFDASSGS
jgi:hypothetical protein